MVTPSFRFTYHCKGIQHNQWIIYISPRERSQANIKRKIYFEILFKGIILLLIIISETKPHILKDDFRKLQSRYKNYQQIYTDGSKEDLKVGCAVISDNHSNMLRIPDDSSIFSAEAKAVDLALDFISTCDANNKLLHFLTRFLY